MKAPQWFHSSGSRLKKLFSYWIFTLSWINHINHLSINVQQIRPLIFVILDCGIRNAKAHSHVFSFQITNANNSECFWAVTDSPSTLQRYIATFLKTAETKGWECLKSHRNLHKNTFLKCKRRPLRMTFQHIWTTLIRPTLMSWEASSLRGLSRPHSHDIWMKQQEGEGYSALLTSVSVSWPLLWHNTSALSTHDSPTLTTPQDDWRCPLARKQAFVSYVDWYSVTLLSRWLAWWFPE